MAQRGADGGLPEPDVGLDQRVDDLLGRMTLAEKAGMLFQTMIVVGSGDLAERNSTFRCGERRAHDQQPAAHPLQCRPRCRRRQGACGLAQPAARAGCKHQARYPHHVVDDPRNHFTENVGTAATAGTFSQWPETLGLAAIGSSELVERFADIARQEYLAVGLRLALILRLTLLRNPAGLGSAAVLARMQI